jgi:hypothetical protein
MIQPPKGHDRPPLPSSGIIHSSDCGLAPDRWWQVYSQEKEKLQRQWARNADIINRVGQTVPFRIHAHTG